jgi:uncharacterized protein YifN (PemK superfamily)
MTKLERMSAAFAAGEIDKFEFYDETRWYPARLVAQVSGIDLEVVRDRRRYLNQLRRQGNSR